MFKFQPGEGYGTTLDRIKIITRIHECALMRRSITRVKDLNKVVGCRFQRGDNFRRLRPFSNALFKIFAPAETQNCSKT